ncbi:glycosyl hydrolase family 28-related protein, partial [Escherichia coli]
AVQRTQHDKNKDVINVKDFGAKGDGSDHPLSEVFPSLASAQAVYPFVTSLSQTQDYAGIQAAINAAKTLNAAVFLPSGQYITNTTITADYAVSMYGEGGQGLR